MVIAAQTGCEPYLGHTALYGRAKIQPLKLQLLFSALTAILSVCEWQARTCDQFQPLPSDLLGLQTVPQALWGTPELVVAGIHTLLQMPLWSHQDGE